MMGRMLRGFLMLVAIVLTAVAGVLPACGTMNGGGTKYLIDPLPDASIVALA
jgi:predicted small secreted protein